MRLALLLLWAVPLAAHPGWGMVEDGQGNVYVGDVIANVVWRIGPAGDVKAVARGRHAHVLCVDAAGSVWGEHTDYDAATKRFSKSRWRLDGEEAKTAMGGCDSLERGRPEVSSAAPRERGWEIYVASQRDGAWFVLEHAPVDEFEKRLKGKGGVMRVRRVDARGVSRVLLLR